MTTPFREEQELELEALASLFSNEGEFVKRSSNSFDLNLVPDPTKASTNYVELSLRILYPEMYPQDRPSWSFIQSKGLDATQLSSLQEIVEREIESNLGSPSIYMIAEALHDYLRNNNRPPLSGYDQMINRSGSKRGAPEGDQQQVAETAPPVFQGLEDKQLCSVEERITESEFREWSQRFKEEMVTKGVWGRASPLRGGLTGRQMFERGDQSLILQDLLLGAPSGTTDVGVYYDELLFLDGEADAAAADDDDDLL